MKSLTNLLHYVLADASTWCHISTSQDEKYILTRVEHEGLSFLTITLPNFGKDFEKSLDQGFVSRNLFQGFTWKGGLPRFLSGFLETVFDRFTGVLVDNPNVDAIRFVRQITLMFKKIEVPCSPARERAAISKYIDCEKEVRLSDKRMDPGLFRDFLRISGMLYGDLFHTLDRKILNMELVPKHGPGATADKLKGNKKFQQLEWTDRMENIFPMGRYVFPSWYSFLDEYDSVTFLEPGAERPSRLVSVPKTLKTPRLIAIEPTCMQYMQQAVLDSIRDYVDRDDLLSRFISDKSQTFNQVMARKGSIDGSLATLDLSEASDRVSNQHVRGMLRNHTNLLEGVDACRSRKVDVPGHGVIRLAKFASMGSALCFPFEAMVFLAVVFLGIQLELKRQILPKDIKSFIGRVRVYGDDIIIPRKFVTSVMVCLSAFGFKVNTDKSFWNGKFRESCGKEYYDGVDVSIVRSKLVLPSSRRHVDEIVSSVSLMNRLYEAGYNQAGSYLESLLSKFICLPRVSPTSSALGVHVQFNFTVERMSQDLHKPLVKAYVPVSVLPESKLSGWPALEKFFLKKGEEPFEDKNHLLRAGRPVSLTLKYRWTSPI